MAPDHNGKWLNYKAFEQNGYRLKIQRHEDTKKDRVLVDVTDIDDGFISDAPCWMPVTDFFDDDWAPPETFTATKKPVSVEAFGPLTDTTVVETLEGDFEIDEEYLDEHGAYYLIRGVEGEIYPCGADIFEQTYTVNGRGDSQQAIDDAMWLTERTDSTTGDDPSFTRDSDEDPDPSELESNLSTEGYDE